MRNELTHVKRCSSSAFVLIGWLVANFAATTALAQSGNGACGPLTTAYGPYDYRTDRDKLPIVLNNHFTAEVEALVRGKTSATPGGDIDFTLRAIPNNHRVLLAMMRLGEKEPPPNPAAHATPLSAGLNGLCFSVRTTPLCA